MPRDSHRGFPSPGDGAMSEANSSVQVHLDASSVRLVLNTSKLAWLYLTNIAFFRGLSTSRTRRSTSRRRSPSRNPDQSSRIQAAVNSQSSGFSPVHENLPQEDVLIGLIPATEPSRNSVDELLHGVKRPHDGESAGEPSPKRDKLEEELEQMAVEAHGENQAAPNTDSMPGPSAPSDDGGSVPSTGMRRVLPMRHAQRPSSRGGSGDNGQAGPSNSNSRQDGGSRSRSRRDTSPR